MNETDDTIRLYKLHLHFRLIRLGSSAVVSGSQCDDVRCLSYPSRQKEMVNLTGHHFPSRHILVLFWGRCVTLGMRMLLGTTQWIAI